MITPIIDFIDFNAIIICNEKFKFVFEKPLTSPGYTVYIESVGMKL